MLLVGGGIEADPRRRKVLGRPPFRPRRGMVSAQLHVEGTPVGFVGCHLALHRKQRLREVERVIRAAAALDGPVVVAGDLNERPGGPSWRRLREAGFIVQGTPDWPTFPADDPVKRIDAVLVPDGVRVRHHGDPGVPNGLLATASDHRPVLAVLDL
jgi:endonuclease/exonuclease/phosphatase family metal-dependent hydrolase